MASIATTIRPRATIDRQTSAAMNVQAGTGVPR